MKKHIKLGFTFLLSIITLNAFSNISEPLIGPTITIHMKAIDPNLLKIKDPTLSIMFSEYPISGMELINSSRKTTYRQAISFNEKYTFVIPSPQKIMYVKISATRQLGTSRGQLHVLDNVYMMSSGSVITCIMDENGYVFSGTGSQTLNLQNDLVKLSYNAPDSLYKFKEEKKYLKYFEVMKIQADLALKSQLKLLRKHKNKLSKVDYQILTANCYGYRYFNEIRAHNFEAMDYEDYLDSLKSFYTGKSKLGTIPDLADSILVLSPNYCNYLVLETLMLTRMKQASYHSVSKLDFIANVLTEIEEKYTGILRDKLIALSTISMRNTPGMSGFYRQILGSINNVKYKKLVQQTLEPLIEGQLFKDFKLSGETSKTYSLADFKDKVVLMDFWYTGCVNCSILTSAMKPVYEHFKGNEKVVFVSVSIDKSKEDWLKSVADGKYTHKGSVNLFTNGKGSDDELIKYYNITGYPNLKLIKNGLLFSSIPPKPTIGIQPGLKISQGATDLINIIEEAVAELPVKKI